MDTGSTTIGGFVSGHEREQQTRATIGGGSLVVGGVEQTAENSTVVANSSAFEQRVEAFSYPHSVSLQSLEVRPAQLSPQCRDNSFGIVCPARAKDFLLNALPDLPVQRGELSVDSASGTSSRAVNAGSLDHPTRPAAMKARCRVAR
tara:strand:- start:19753 stop:20193 length:441 start_codon:yes stop_codon:yes gene_type:complete